MDEERNEQVNGNTSGSSEVLKKGAEKIQKNVAKATSQSNLKAKVFTKLAPMLGPIIFWAMVVVIAIVIVVGIGTFLMTTPGIIMDKLEKIAGNVVDALQHYFLGDDLTENVKKEEIVGVLDYLEDMNYDLKGYGFLSSFVDEEDKTYENGKPTGATQYKDDEADGVTRYKEDSEEHSKGDIEEADSKYIFMYLVSDNYIYTVKNNNIAFETGEGPLGVLASLYVGNLIHAADYVTQLIDTFTSFHTAGLTSQVYGQGLINFFYESQFGVQGAPFGNDISNQIELDQNKKTLKIKHSDGLFWANKSEMEYKVDGWAGRYGMPLEFLLSVHIATMMPDLAYDMVQLFPTEVQTYLHYVSGYSTTDGEGNEETVNTYIPYIAKVVNHWYRDVYLVQPEDENTSIVQVDAEYETLVKERWTLYETYTASEAINYGNANLAGEYKLYGLKENGEYATTKEEVKNGSVAMDKLEEATTEDGHNYILFVGTIEEANPTLSIVRNTDSSDTNAQIESVEDKRIPVAKKALTISFGEMAGQENDNDDTDNTQSNDPIYNLRFIFRNNFSSGNDRPLAAIYTSTSWDNIAIAIRNTEEAQKEIKKYASRYSESYEYNIEQIKMMLNNWGYTQEEGQSDWDYISEHRTKIIEMGGETASFYNTIVDGWASNMTKDLVLSLVKKIINNNSSGASDITEMINDYANTMRQEIAENILEEPIDYREDDINDYGWYNTEGVWTAYKLDDNGTFTQEGEGLRTETNPVIKQLFTTNTYFRYDGTKDTAEAIQQLKEAYEIGETSLDFYATSKGKNLDDVLKYKTQLLDESGENKGNPVTIDEVSGQVALNQDSLNAFSILENTHTLDSDYIYRDFKELVVELGYFTKEELTESIPRVLAWIVPDTGSCEYPFNELDKKVNDFGTLIHSKGDIDVYKKKMLAEAIVNSLDDGSDQEEEERQNQEEENNNLSKLDNTIKSVRKIYGVSDDEDLILRGNKNYFLSEGGNTSSNSSSGIPSIDEWWESNQEMFDVFKTESWTYEQDHSCATFEDARKSQHTTDCSLMTSWSLQRIGVLQEGNTFCSDMGSSGSLDGSASAQDLIDAGAEIIAPAAGTKFPSSASNGTLEPGDILFYDGHVSLFCGPDYENCVDTSCWDCGSVRGIQNGGPVDKSGEGRDIKLIVRLPLGNKKNKGEKYKGYEGNEGVVSPVTGILLEYGTYDNTDKGKDERVNSDINCKEIDEKYRLTSTKENYEDKVGYAKIMVLNAENYKKLEVGTNSQFKNNSLLKSEYNTIGINQKFEEKLENEDELENWSAIDQTIYGYKEFAELYEKTGIAGNIIYIDGFKCEDVVESDEKGLDKIFDGGEKIGFSDFDVSEGNIENEESVRPSLYEDDTEYKDINLKITDRLKAEGKTKTNAVSSIGINATGGDLVSNFDSRNRLVFIKEGTVLGRTITDKELMENTEYRNKKLGAYEDVRGENAKVIGNYLRIIMRNEDDDSIIENVEDYMKLDDGEIENQDLGMEKFLFWMGCLAEGGNLEYKNGTWYSVAINDGVGDPGEPGCGLTHFFGLTNYDLNEYEKATGRREWTEEMKLEDLVNTYLIMIDEDIDWVREKLGEDIPDGYLQGFISLAHNFGRVYPAPEPHDDFNWRADEYLATGQVSENTWSKDYSYSDRPEMDAEMKKRRLNEWSICTKGIYPEPYADDHDTEYDWSSYQNPDCTGVKFNISEETPFSDWCEALGINITAELKNIPQVGNSTGSGNGGNSGNQITNSNNQVQNSNR